jgi:hypothetical protein
MDPPQAILGVMVCPQEERGSTVSSIQNPSGLEWGRERFSAVHDGSSQIPWPRDDLFQKCRHWLELWNHRFERLKKGTQGYIMMEQS